MWEGKYNLHTTILPVSSTRKTVPLLPMPPSSLPFFQSRPATNIEVH